MNLKEIPTIPGFKELLLENFVWGVVPLVAILVVGGFIAFMVSRSDDAEAGEIFFFTVIIGLAVGALVLFASLMNSHFAHVQESRDVAFENISATYNLEFDKNQMLFDFTEDDRVGGASTDYVDSKTDTKYDLTFVFKDGKTPTLLKTSTVTEELISQLQK